MDPKVRIRVITYKEPSFRGLHNSVKTKILLILYREQLSGNSGLKPHEIASKAGLKSVNSVTVLLRRLKKWLYVSQPRPFIYKLATKGEEWLKRWVEKGVLPLDKYIAEIESNQKRI